MTITRAKPAGWVDDDALTGAQISHIDEQLPKLADFSAGSTHAPAAQVIVNGAGMRVTPLSSGAFTGDSISLTEAESPSIAIPLIAYGGTYWDAPFDSAASGTIVRQNNVGGGDLIFFALPPLPRGCTILGVTANVKPEASHSGVPATKPMVQLEWCDYTTNTINAVAAQVDTSATLGAYDVMHAITASCSHAYNASRLYRVRMRGESGANALTAGGKALAIYGLTVQVTGAGLHL